MTRMLGALVDRARKERLKGLYGEAVTVHDISQRVNHKLGFHSTALILAALPITRYKQLVESYPQDMSAVIDFLVLESAGRRRVYLPRKYKRLLGRIYTRMGIEVEELQPTHPTPANKTQLDVDIAYHNQSAVVIVRRFGRDFRDSIIHTAASLDERDINAIYVDLPLDNPCVEHGSKTLDSLSYVCAGLMPMFHHDRDYLRMQLIRPRIDFDLIATYSPMAHEIKKQIQNELTWITRRQNAASPYG
jgi:hypothetical protein